MSNLNLTGQATLASSIQPKIVNLKSAMNERKPIWDKLNNTKRKAWIDSNKDPIMSLAWSIYNWLHNNFFEDFNYDL